MAATEMVMMVRWGTWEELLLGSAVLRHGTRAWDSVAAELRARALYPYNFTAEVCKAKYEDLQERYCDCTAWFEELRKQRVAELKRELEKSEGSIGSLESKLENLKAEKGSSRTESPVTPGNLERVEFLGKETSKDGLSAGSFTEEARTNRSPVCQNPASVSSQEAWEDSEKDKTGVEKNMGGGRGGASVRKQRGKRKRKDCSKEGSVGENDVWSSAVAVDSLNGRLGVVDDETFDLMGILNTVLEIENSSVFRSRLDSQKRTRYKKTIRRHMDFDTIRSRIIDRSITSGRELYRDLLLLATNAMVFYPKHSREYQSAISLKDFATRTFCQYRKDYSRDNAAADLVAEPRTRNPPVKPRSIRPCNRKVTGKVAGVGKAIAVNPSQEDEKACDADSPVESPALTKRSVGRPGKGGRGSGRKRPETPAKGRKRVRRW